MKTIIPVYYQIKQSLKRRILSQEISLGAKIPSENDLAKKFSVSRLTVRQALSELSQEGFLISKRGVGTFVTNNEDLINNSCLEVSGFLDDLFYQISQVKAKTVEIDKIQPTKNAIEKLMLSEKDEEVIRIKRIRFRGSKAFAYTINYLPVEIGSRISKKDLYRKPLLQIIEQDLGIRLTEAVQTTEASFASHEVAEKLNIPGGSPVLYIERTMLTHGRKPVEFVQSSHRGDIYKYFVRLKRVQRKQGTTWMSQTE